MGAGPLAKNLEDQAGSVDDLRLPTSFQIALLHRRQRTVDDNETDRVVLDPFGNVFDRAAAKQGCRSRP